MHQVIRGGAQVSTVIGWMLISMAAVATAVFLILPFALGETWMLVFLFAALAGVARRVADSDAASERPATPRGSGSAA